MRLNRPPDKGNWRARTSRAAFPRPRISGQNRGSSGSFSADLPRLGLQSLGIAWRSHGRRSPCDGQVGGLPTTGITYSLPEGHFGIFAPTTRRAILLLATTSPSGTMYVMAQLSRALSIRRRLSRHSFCDTVPDMASAPASRPCSRRYSNVLFCLVWNSSSGMKVQHMPISRVRTGRPRKSIL